MDALACLPHQPPIRVVETLEVLGEGRAVASFEVRPGPLVAEGRLWSGALIEGLAQTAALLGTQLAGGEQGPAPIRGLLVGLRGLELRRLPALGERVRCEVELLTRLGGGVLVKGAAYAGEELLAAGRLQFVMEPA